MIEVNQRVERMYTSRYQNIVRVQQTEMLSFSSFEKANMRGISQKAGWFSLVATSLHVKAAEMKLHCQRPPLAIHNLKVKGLHLPIVV
jgi:hypothetical protein